MDGDDHAVAEVDPWTKVSLTKAGRAFSRVLDSGNGYVSTRRSSYANGVRLYSGSAEAGVQYKFKVHAARFYRKFSFRVLGRSPNGEQALMLIWNPDLGSYKYASSFDSPRLTGRGYHWWSRKATLSGRVVSGYARTGSSCSPMVVTSRHSISRRSGSSISTASCARTTGLYRSTAFVYHRPVLDRDDPDPQVDETWTRLLAAIVEARGGELRLPRHYLDALPITTRITATLDPVTDDVVIRINP